MHEIEFSWDGQKAKQNLRKHKVSFEEAVTVFYDENAVVFFDPDHSQDEDRFLMLGLSARLRVLEPIPITQSIPAGCKTRCLRCRPKTFSAWNKPRLRAFLACRLGLGLFAQPHDDQVIRIGS
jgi:uncharacterized DUF497 family protein